MPSDSCQTPGPSEAPTHCHQTSGWLCATSHGTTDEGASWSPGKLYRRSAKSGADMLHTEARPCQWAMPSPRRTRGIETHNAIADDAGIGDMPPRKRTTPQTQPAFAGNQRLVPDADFLFAFSQHTITRDEWIAPFRQLEWYANQHQKAEVKSREKEDRK